MIHAQKYATIIADKAGETLSPESQLVGRVFKDGRKSGGKKKFPVEVQERIDQMWQEIVIARLGFQNLQKKKKKYVKLGRLRTEQYPTSTQLTMRIF